jgi:hypothetical protein
MLLNGGVHIGTNNSEHLTISSSGKVGIGTTSPQNTLSVAGTVQAYEVLVNTGWSDYIFAPNYYLPPLKEVKAYIEQNHHLPEIPTASEVEDHGVAVGAMESKLLAEVEELTLHMIHADEQSQRLEQQQERDREIGGCAVRCSEIQRITPEKQP